MSKPKYVNGDDFNAFKTDFQTMVSVFNHSVSDIKEDVREIKKDLKTMNEKNNTEHTFLTKAVTELAAQFGVTSKVVWFIMGTITLLIGAGITAAMRGGA